MRKLAPTLVSVAVILGSALLLNYGIKTAIGVSIFLLVRCFLDSKQAGGTEQRPWWSVNKRIRLLALAVVTFFVGLIGYGALVGYE